MGAAVETEHAAILFADVKGYSVLVSRDEVGTYERLRRARALFRALVSDYGGRIVDEAGDGVLAAFPNAGKAVDFALAIQRDLANAAAWQGEVGPFAFRMGIHAGPVHRDGERLYGMTLIVAQRVQEVAPPGRVCVTDAVRELIRTREDVHCVGMGVRQLKNMEPMRVHRVEAPDSTIRFELPQLAADPQTSASEDASIAVLPFENMSLEHSDELLCKSVTTDIIERLCRFREIAVIASNSVFQCRRIANAPAEVAQLLGVRYAAVGSMRRAGDRLRITAQLLDADSSRVLWSDRFDGNLESIFEFQDEVSDIIAARLATHLSIAERRRILETRVPMLSTYGLVLRGEELALHYKSDANLHARHLLEEATACDPNYARAWAGISRSYTLAWRYRWSNDPDACLQRALDLARDAVARDPSDARGFGQLGYAYLYRRELERAMSAYEKAYALNPNDADLLAEMSDAYTTVGRVAEAIELIQRAIRLNPCAPDLYYWHYGEALFDTEKYEDVIRMIGHMRDPTEGERLLTASYALLGDWDNARLHAAAVRRAYPDFSSADWKRVPPGAGRAPTERFFEGLRLAGL